MKEFMSWFVFAATLLMLPLSSAWADGIVPAQSTESGRAAMYSLSVLNPTDSAQTYHLSTSGLPDLFTTSFRTPTGTTNEVTVPPNGYEQIAMQVDVPLGTPVRSYMFRLEAADGDGRTFTQDLFLDVRNTYSMHTVPDTVGGSVFSGQEFGFSATVLNTGAAPITGVKLQVEAPTKWVVLVEPGTVPVLKVGDSAAFSIRVLVPASQGPGPASLLVGSVSDQTVEPKETTTVQVQKKPGYLVASAVIVVVAGMGMIFYFRRKGRR